MSFAATVWAWRQDAISAMVKLVLLCLADYADENGMCFPSQEKVAAKTGLTDRSVRTAIGTLREMRLITVTKRVGTSDVFHLDMSSAGDTPEGASALPDGTAEGDSAHPGKTFRSPRKEIPTTPEGASYEPITYPANEPANEPATHSRSSAKDDKRQATARREPSADSAADEFEAFWERYPRKAGKGQARTAYQRARRKASAAEILTAIDRHPWSPDPQFIPYASTWLNGERWTDQPVPPAPRSPSGRVDERAAEARRNADRIRELEAELSGAPPEPADDPFAGPTIDGAAFALD